MAMQWADSLSVGVREIDNQHKELIAQINKLLQAMGQGKGRDEIGKVVKFLEDYVVQHFAAEEKYMSKYGYPQSGSHKAEHLAFTRDFASLKKEYEKEGATGQVVIQVQRRVGDWLISHIGKIDKSLGAFLVTKL